MTWNDPIGNILDARREAIRRPDYCRTCHQKGTVQLRNDDGNVMAGAKLYYTATCPDCKGKGYVTPLQPAQKGV